MLSLNPWINIWIHPKKVIKQIVAHNPNFRLWVLSTIAGFSSLMFLEQLLSPGFKYSLKAILLFSVIAAPFWGYFILSLLSFLVRTIGKAMGSKGNYSDIRAVAGWACVPYTVTVACWIVMIAFFKNELFRNFPQSISLSESQTNFVLTVLGIKLAMNIWSFVIYIQGLTLIQEFTISKTILNIIFVIAILAIFIFLLWTAIVNTCGYFFNVPLITFRF